MKLTMKLTMREPASMTTDKGSWYVTFYSNSVLINILDCGAKDISGWGLWSMCVMPKSSHIQWVKLPVESQKGINEV